jgi:hypothetical protein
MSTWPAPSARRGSRTRAAGEIGGSCSSNGLEDEDEDEHGDEDDDGDEDGVPGSGGLPS